MRLIFRFHPVWAAFFVSKLAYMLLALYVFERFTSLGDTRGYLASAPFVLDDFGSTSLMRFLGGTFSFFLGGVLGNVPFVLLSFFGIYYSVSRLDLNRRQLTFLLGLLSFPSVGMWTSIASKEAVGVFFLGVIFGFLIDLIKNKPRKNFLLVALAFVLCAVFKPQYLIGIAALLFYIFITRSLNLKGSGKLFTTILVFFLSGFALYLFRIEINDLSFMMPAHFSLQAGSTRENTIWVNDYDVFWSAPYGMVLAFMGPTLSEAMAKPTHLIALLESAIIIAIFGVAVLKLLLISTRTSKINIFYLSVFMIPVLWILFVHYPFGVLNPGSAIRYRQNFYPALVVLFYFVYLEIKRSYVYRAHPQGNNIGLKAK
jgi:hypothetical protein